MAKKYYLDGRVFKPGPGRNTSFIDQANPIFLNDIIEEVVGISLPVVPATTTVQGIVELATNAETIAGVSTTTVVTPASLAAALGTIGDLESVLTNGNTTGANDISITAGQVISSTSGDASLDLAYGAPNSILLSSDGVVGLEGYAAINSTYASLGFGQVNNVITDINSVYLQSSAAIPAGYISPASTGVYDTAGPAVNSPILVTASTNGNYTNNGGGAIAVFINTGNSVDSQINNNVNNSVIVGGDGITAKTDNTAYVNQVGFCANGATFEGLLDTNTLTADRTYELPNASGVVSLVRYVAVATPTVHTAVTGEVVAVTTGAGALVVNLPSAALDNQMITIKKVDVGAGAVTVTAAGLDTIDGAATYPLAAQWNSVTLVSDGGSAWLVVATV